MGNAIETHGLTKYYGVNRGVVGLDLAVREGEVFGFLGPNGAGKTTTIRLLLNLLQPTSGSAAVLGMDVAAQSLDVRRACGVVSSDSAFYESLSGRAHLALMQSHHNGGEHRGGEIAERLGLELDRPVKQYSHGTRQKLAIVQALAHRPRVLVLDEPTSGLDPLVQQEFFKLLLEERDRGVTIFFSSHVLSEVDRLCDRVGIIREGVLAADAGRGRAAPAAGAPHGGHAVARRRAGGLRARRRDRCRVRRATGGAGGGGARRGAHRAAGGAAGGGRRLPGGEHGGHLHALLRGRRRTRSP